MTTSISKLNLKHSTINESVQKTKIQYNTIKEERKNQQDINNNKTGY